MRPLAALAVAVLLVGGCSAPPHLSIDLIFGRHGPQVVAEAHAIVEGPTARCPNGESGGDPAAVSPGGGNHGLWQINNVHRRQFEAVTRQPWETGRYNAWWSTYYANWLYEQQGWGPWSCAR